MAVRRRSGGRLGRAGAVVESVAIRVIVVRSRIVSRGKRARSAGRTFRISKRVGASGGAGNDAGSLTRSAEFALFLFDHFDALGEFELDLLDAFLDNLVVFLRDEFETTVKSKPHVLDALVERPFEMANFGLEIVDELLLVLDLLSSESSCT